MSVDTLADFFVNALEGTARRHEQADSRIEEAESVRLYTEAGAETMLPSVYELCDMIERSQRRFDRHFDLF